MFKPASYRPAAGHDRGVAKKSDLGAKGSGHSVNRRTRSRRGSNGNSRRRARHSRTRAASFSLLTSTTAAGQAFSASVFDDDGPVRKKSLRSPTRFKREFGTTVKADRHRSPNVSRNGGRMPLPGARVPVAGGRHAINREKFVFGDAKRS